MQIVPPFGYGGSKCRSCGGERMAAPSCRRLSPGLSGAVDALGRRVPSLCTAARGGRDEARPDGTRAPAAGPRGHSALATGTKRRVRRRGSCPRACAPRSMGSRARAPPGARGVARSLPGGRLAGPAHRSTCSAPTPSRPHSAPGSTLVIAAASCAAASSGMVEAAGTGSHTRSPAESTRPRSGVWESLTDRAADAPRGMLRGARAGMWFAGRTHGVGAGHSAGKAVEQPVAARPDQVALAAAA